MQSFGNFGNWLLINILDIRFIVFKIVTFADCTHAMPLDVQLTNLYVHYWYITVCII